MASAFVDDAVRLGGGGHAFGQKDYISANKWDAARPEDCGGALQGGRGLKGGVCLVLSALYLASKGDWSVFRNAMVSPGGLAHVRGLMNIQDEATRSKKSRTRMTPGACSFATAWRHWGWLTVAANMLKKTGRSPEELRPLLKEGVDT